MNSALAPSLTEPPGQTQRPTWGHAVKAMILNGLGFVNQRLSLVPLSCQHKPTHRLIALGIEAQPRQDAMLRRALDTLDDYGVTELYRLIAVTAAPRLGVTPRFAHLDSPSVHVDGRDNSTEEPDAHIIHIRRSDSRDHRPNLTQVLLNLIVEHQAGLPLLMKPLSGTTSRASAFGQVVSAPIAQMQTTYGPTYMEQLAQHLAIRRIQEIFRTNTDRLYHWADDRQVPADNNLAKRYLCP
jgi:transposase